MSFSWTTFIVEIVNFIILMWLLTHFFYQPVTRAIAARREAIRADIEHAETLKSQADELQRRYETRLQEWESEKAALRATFEETLAAERTKREAALEVSLERAREAARATDLAHEEEMRHRLEDEAREHGAEFSAALLARFASPALEMQIIEATLADVRTLPPERRALISRAVRAPADVKITTRYPAGEDARKAIADVLHGCLTSIANIEFAQDEKLVAGIHIDLGTIALEGNLSEELRWFATAETHDA